MEGKGQGDTFWVVIGAVIALVVLVVLILIFTGKMNLFEKGLGDCGGKGGFCVGCSKEITNDCESKCRNRGEGYSYSSIFECPNKETDGCCLGARGS